MTSRDRGHDRSLQDDRNDLGVDAEDASPLVKGEGAPLADDAVSDAGTNVAPGSVVAPAFLGGAPIPAPDLDVTGRARAHDPMTTAEDQPIDD
jgi:hypothetical protein